MPPRKKTKEVHAPQKPVVQKLRGRRGSLAAMPGVPLDVIVEILGHLQSKDILNLARTSKDFRALLLNRQNAFIWKAARKALPGELPDPHPYMSEPALAQLMFSGHCQNCGKDRVRKIVWLWLKRYCSKCLPLMTLDASAVQMRMYAIGLSRVPDSNFSAIFSCERVRSTARWNEFNNCHAPQVQRFEQEWHEAGDHPESLAKLYRDQKARVEKEIKLAKQLEEWVETDRMRRLARARQAREDNLIEIRRRLKEVGWGVEAEYYSDTVRSDLLYGPGRRFYSPSETSKLTDREWQKVYRHLEARMIALRSRRLNTLWESTFDKIHTAITLHYTSRPAGESRCTLEHGPTAMDIAWMPESEELFVDSGIANGSALNAYLNTVVAPRVPQLVALWEERLMARLRELVVVAVSPAHVPEDIDPLDLAVAVFGCTHCETIPHPPAPAQILTPGPPLAVRFPAILAHKCFTKCDRWYPKNAPLPFTQAYRQHIFKRERDRADRTWFPQVATFPIDPERISLKGAQKACAALLGAHCDPGRVTLQEMQTWDFREGKWFPPAHMIVKPELAIANVVCNDDGRTADVEAPSADSGLWDAPYVRDWSECGR